MTKKKSLLKRGKFNSFQDGGREQEIRGYSYEKKPKDKLTDLSLLDLAKYGISRTIMDLGEYVAEGYSLKSAPKETYLMDRDSQERVLLNRGYVKGKNRDYGTVKSAVGDKDIPVYQTLQDSINRENLLVMGNVGGLWFGPYEANMEDPGSYSSAIYVDPISGKIYQKAWDLNDYGDKNRVGKGRTYDDGTFKGKVLQKAANTIDAVGSPTVITTGFHPVKAAVPSKIKFKEVSLSDIPSSIFRNFSFRDAVVPFIHSKGLDFTKLDNDTYTVTLPEVVITSEENNKNKDSNKKEEGGPIGMQSHRSNPFDVNAQLPMDYWLNLSNSNPQIPIQEVPIIDTMDNSSSEYEITGTSGASAMWQNMPDYMRQVPSNYERINTNIRNAATSVDIASNPLIDNYSKIASNPIQISKDITGIPDKIDVKVGGKSLAEGSLTNQELGIKPKTDWNSVASKGMTGLSGAISIAQSTMANAKIKDTTGIQTAIDAAANTTFGGSTNEQLMAQYGAIEDLDRTSQRDLTGSIGSKLLNTGKATLSGVQAGMKIGGPIGGIIGGVVGLGTSVGGWIAGDTKAQNEAERLNKEAAAAEQRRLANFDLAVNNLEQQNLMYDMANYAKYGGPLFNEFSNGITKINEGGSHEENPYEGIQVGVDPEGIPNLVEEGEVIFNDYVFSSRLVVPDKVRTKYKLRKSKDLSFADAANEIQKMAEEMPNDPIVKRTMETQMQELMMEQEQVRMKKDKNKRKNKFDYGGIMSPLEYIEPALSVGQGLQSLFIKPDYSHLDAYEDAINAANVKVSSSPVKTNMRYTPMDTRGLLSEASANRAATNRALMNTSGANPAIARTALTNADYNYNNQLGKLWRSIEEAEYNRQLGFEQFRTNLENANRARDLQVAGINADILAKNASLRGDYANRQLAVDNATSAVISGNIDAAKQSLAGLARQDTNNRMLQMLKDEGYFYNPEKYKDLLARIDELEKDSKKSSSEGESNQSKYGGRIKRKRRLS